MTLSQKQLADIATLVRRDVLEMTTEAKSGHPTSCLSSADLMTVLWFAHMRFDPSNADNPDNDEFIMSKGHAAPLYYSILQRTGCIGEDLRTLRKHKSTLEGHPMPSPTIPWIKAATGSLGQGLSIGLGMALAITHQKRKANVYVLMGDSECAEGSVWEAVELASHYNASNLCAIIDVNRLGQRGETMLGHNIIRYKKRFESFGWNVLEINGHSIPQIVTALGKLSKSKKPTVILAKTLKGKGVSFVEDKEGWHGKTLSQEECVKACKELGNPPMPDWFPTVPEPSKQKPFPHLTLPEITSYSPEESVATREAYGKALAKLAAYNPNIQVLDAEVSNSTYAEKVKERAPHQFLESYIAEQNMIGMAQGFAIKGHVSFASSFAAFLTRAHDQLRMLSLSQTPVVVCGSHAGTSIGEDGPSQMGLDDIAMMRTMPRSVILYPSDAVSTEKCVALAAETPSLTYIRTTRAKTPIIYKEREEFMLNEFKTVRQSPHDSFVIATAGITLHEALKAHDTLKKEGTAVAVLDCYSIKPFPVSKFVEFVQAHGKRVLVLEDHYPEGGLGELLAHALVGANVTFIHNAVKSIPHSATPTQQLELQELNANAIVKTIKRYT